MGAQHSKRECFQIPDTLDIPISLYARQLSLYELGKHYQSGGGLSGSSSSKDAISSLHCFQQAADMGYAPAQLELGVLLELSSQYHEAVQWYSHVASSTCKASAGRASFLLGQCYSRGSGVQYNPELAFLWFKRSVDQVNDPRALYNMSYCLESAIGTKQDLELSHVLLQQAARQGHLLAQTKVKTK